MMTEAMKTTNQQTYNSWECLDCIDSGLFTIDGEQHANKRRHSVRVVKYETYVFQPIVQKLTPVEELQLPR